MNGPVLAIDTSVTIAVGLADDERVLGSVSIDDTRSHVEQLTDAIAGLLGGAGLTTAELGGLVVGMGPGPFTGLRVGIVTAWTLAETVGVGWHGICGLDVVAAQWTDAPDEFVVCADARRHELYWAHYRDGVRTGDPQVGPAAALPDLPVVGPGVSHYRDQLAGRAADGPSALDPAALAVLGPRLPSAGDQPWYLRRPDATVPTQRKSALPTGPRRLPGLVPGDRS